MKRRKVVLLTGASTGIGLALARKLIQTEFRVVLTARESSLYRFDKEGIQASDRVVIRALDVCDYKQQLELMGEIKEKWGGVDILINNAGISYRSVVEEMTLEDTQYQIEVNYLAPMQLIRLALPWMRSQRWGRIINISSVGGMMAMPTMAAYSASKFALEGASEALWYEMKPWGISVTLIRPGFVRSKSFQNVYFTKKSHESSLNHRSTYYQYYYHMGRFISKRMNSSAITPEDIAALVLETIRRSSPPLRIHTSVNAWLFYAIRRFLPRRLYHKLLYHKLPENRLWVNDESFW